MPADPTPAGGISVPIATLAEMVADSQAFQTAAGLTAPDPDAREKLIFGGLGELQRIFYPSLEVIGEIEQVYNRLPIAVVQLPSGWGYRKRAGGARNYFPFPDGNLELYIAARDEHPQDINRGFLAFGNLLGQIVIDVKDQAAESDRLPIDSIRLRESVAKSPRSEEAQLAGAGYWSAWFTVGFNV